MQEIPKEIADQSLPLPNIYFVTVMHVQTGVHSFYLAADSSAAAVQKVRNYCAEQFGFRPYRSTTDIKLRRFLLGDYLENPQGLQEAVDIAHAMGERSTVESLEGRMADVQSLLQTTQEATSVDFDEVAEKLANELRDLDRKNG